MNYQEERSKDSKWFFGLIKVLAENKIEFSELGYRERDKEVTIVTNTAGADLMLIGEGYKVDVADGRLYVKEDSE